MTHKKLSQIKLLLLDVDGVLTDGKIIHGNSGEEIKGFNVKDGLGIRLLMNAGIRVGIITGRSSKALSKRCRELGIDLLYQGVKDKVKILETILVTTGTSLTQIAFVGDDLPDLPVMSKVGLSITVSDASPEVIERADMITSFKGGNGAVREVCEAILKSQNLWQQATDRYLS